MALGQSLQQKLLQKLSPQQIQLMKLLQVPTANLEERIKEELEENPALEQSEEDYDDQFDENKDEFEASADEEFEAEGTEDEYENIDISDYVSDDDGDIAEYKTRDENYPEADENKTVPYRIQTSFHEHLQEQLGMLKLDDKQKKISEQIVGSIDDDGYLRRETIAIVDDLAFRQNIETNELEVEN
ncbi:MAG TPA: hypothetical protein VM101_07470, partial [Flavitalea sp.]|nr:hypothetical protein [Flavitalea sp.]